MTSRLPILFLTLLCAFEASSSSIINRRRCKHVTEFKESSSTNWISIGGPIPSFGFGIENSSSTYLSMGLQATGHSVLFANCFNAGGYARFFPFKDALYVEGRLGIVGLVTLAGGAIGPGIGADAGIIINNKHSRMTHRIKAGADIGINAVSLTFPQYSFSIFV